MTFLAVCPKRNIMRRILSLMLACVLLVSLLTVFVSCDDKDMGPTYMTIGGVDVPYDVVKCFVKQELRAYSEEDLKSEVTRQKIRDDVLENLKRKHCAIYAVAKEYDLSLTEEAKKDIKSVMQEYRKSTSYAELLSSMFATDAVLEEFVKVDYLDYIVYDFLCDFNERFDDTPDTILADIEKGNWYAAEYVVLYYDSVNYNARKEDMEEVRTAVLNGESLKDAASTIQRYYGDEYRYALDGCFPEGIYPEDVEKAVKALEFGEVGEVLDTYTSDGYACFMLIRRQKITDAYVDKNFDTVKANYLVRVYNEFMAEKIEALDVVIAEKYANADLLEIE